MVGIIGRNGAGKSTLLKILSRITEPSEGRVPIRGRVASLLEVGTGFHPELTGRENIYLNGAILGMTRLEIERKFDEIVAFAEVEKFLDTPVKHYSQRHVRAAGLRRGGASRAGDSDRRRSAGRRRHGVPEKMPREDGERGDPGRKDRVVRLAQHGSYRADSVNRALLIGEGRIKASGAVDEVIKAYTRSAPSLATTNIAPLFRGPLCGKLHFKSISIISDSGPVTSLVSPATRIHIEAIGECLDDIPAFRTTMAVFSGGVRLFSMHDVPHAETLKAGCTFKSVYTLPPYFLRPADYFVALGGHSATNGEWLWGGELAQFTILEEWGRDFRAYDTGLINIQTCGQRVLQSSHDTSDKPIDQSS